MSLEIGPMVYNCLYCNQTFKRYAVSLKELHYTGELEDMLFGNVMY